MLKFLVTLSETNTSLRAEMSTDTVQYLLETIVGTYCSGIVETYLPERTFALVHICVRNDDHCPICRRYYVSFHTSWACAYARAIQQIEDEDAHAELERHSYCWVDEWVRRSNGDMFRICPVAAGTRWDLSDWGSINVGKQVLCQSKEVKFIALQISVDPAEWCPANLHYSIALFHTAEEAASDLVSKYNDELESDEPESKSDLNEDRLHDLQTLRPAWVVQLHNRSANYHFQVIDIDKSMCARIELNKYCPHIQPDVWHKISENGHQ